MIPYEKALLQSVETKNAVVLTAENRSCLRNIPEKIGDKFIDVGIAEQTLIGVSAGLAKEGYIPVIHALAAFLTMRSFEFVRTDLGYPGFASILIGTFAGLQSTANGPTHQAVEDLALMSLVPNGQSFAPYGQADLVQAIHNCDQLKGPLYIRYYDDEKPGYEAPNWGQNKALLSGEKVAVLTYGWLCDEALKAAGTVTQEGLTPSVYNCRFVSPSPAGFLERILENYETVIVLEDHGPKGGLLDEVLKAKATGNSSVTIVSQVLDNHFFVTGTYTDALTLSGLSADQLIPIIRKAYT